MATDSISGEDPRQRLAYLLLPAWTSRLRIVAAGTNTVVKDLGRVRVKGRTSYTALAVGFLTPEDDYPGFDVFVSKDG